MRWQKETTYVVIAGALAIMIFVADLTLPPETAVWFLYLVPVAFSSWGLHRGTPFVFAGICTALILLDFYFMRPGVATWVLTTNGCIGIVLLWFTALGQVQRKRATEDNERLALFPSENPNPVLRLRRDGVLLYANEASRKLLQDWHCAVGSLAPDFLRKSTAQAFAKRLSHLIEVKSGERVFSFFAVPVVKAGYINLYGRDETERKRAEETMRLSEAKYRKLHVSMMDGFVFVDMKGRVIESNGSYQQMLGYSSEELARMTYRDLTPEKWHALEQRIVEEQILPKGYSNVYEKEYWKKDGTIIPVELHTFLIKNDAGENEGMWAIVRDITERKRMEEELRSEKTWSEAIISSAPNIIVGLGEGSKILIFNRFAEKLTGYMADEVMGRSWIEIFTPAALHQQLRGVWDEVVNNKLIEHHYENPVVTKHGKERIISWNNSVLTLDDKFKMVLSIGEDITEHKRAEEAMRQAEEKYRGIFEGVPVGIYQSRLDGGYVTANLEFARILGYDSPEEVIASTTDLHEDFYVQSGRRAEFIKKICIEGTVSGFESQAYRRDRSIICVSENARTVRDEQGALTGFEGTMTDITVRRKAEESMHRLLQAVGQTDEIVFMTDASGKITYVNPAFEQIYGYTMEEVRTGTPRILKSGQLDHATYGPFWETILSGQTIHNELINKTKDGRLVTVDSTVSPVFDSHHVLTGFIAVQRDITGQKKSEEERKLLEKELYQSQKFESLGTMAGGIAHDFNNVLAIILGYTTILQHSSTDLAKASKSIAAINEAAERGADLVRQILMFARRDEPTLEPLAVNLVITEVQRMVQGTFPKNIAVTTNLDSQIPTVTADRTQVHQALLNLCVNARDAMPDGGSLSISTRKVTVDEVRMHVIDAEGTDFINMRVSDTGTGIDDATKQRIFEPFFTTKEKGKGTGLGLAVVYSIMKGHKGYVDVRSTPGQGSTFDLFLPATPLPQVEDKPASRERTARAGGGETILVVEDEDMLRQLLKVCLEAEGYVVLTASDGQEAVDVFKTHSQKVALVISDLGLPKLDGAAVFKEFKKIDPQVKVLISSGYIDPGLRADFVKAGVKGFVRKPYKPVEILKKVRETLDGISLNALSG